MNYLDKLLNGVAVEWKTLGEVLKPKGYIRGPFGSALKKEFFIEKGVPVYEQQHAIYDRRNFRYFIDENKAENLKRFKVKVDDIIVSCSGTIGKISIINRDDEIGIINQALLILRLDTTKVINKYIKQYLECNTHLIISSTGGAITNIEKKSVIEKISIPIPPLSVQKEIVRILDTFTELVTELTKELTLRKQQYHYYRDKLLTPIMVNGQWLMDKEVVEWRTLGEVAEYSKKRISSERLDKNNYVGVDNLLQNREGKTISTYVPVKGNLTQYDCNNILIGNIRPYLKKIWLSDRVGGTNGDVLVIQITNTAVKAKFLFQVLADDKFFEYNMQHAKGAKMPRGNKDKIMEYKIPIPSLETQNRIVSILDQFDTLTASISEGLPKEIELRQQQYEYYRNSLLSFPKP
jgi:type I restriction enzyme, S subunit